MTRIHDVQDEAHLIVAQSVKVRLSARVLDPDIAPFTALWMTGNAFPYGRASAMSVLVTGYAASVPMLDVPTSTNGVHSNT